MRPALLSITLLGAAFAQTPDSLFSDEPVARALYDSMVSTLQTSRTLTWSSRYIFETDGKAETCSYRAWLKKPGFARIDAAGGSAGVSARIVADSTQFSLHWQGGRPKQVWEDSAAWVSTRMTAYRRETLEPGEAWIAWALGKSGTGIAAPVIDPSLGLGSEDYTARRIDAIRLRGTEAASGESCDVIEVSLRKGQRSKLLWLARRDRLPRRLREEYHAARPGSVTEEWSDVAVDRAMPDSLFRWTPPDARTELREPELEQGLLPAGTSAPDFDLATVDGSRLRLSNLRGKVVLLYFWRTG